MYLCIYKKKTLSAGMSADMLLDFILDLNNIAIAIVSITTSFCNSSSRDVCVHFRGLISSGIRHQT